jgi:hypothetical protein
VTLPNVLEPEVAGGWGPGTEADTAVHPPIVRRLVFQFDDWLGDDLLETFPCFIVTERLAAAIESSELTGVQLGSVDITKSELFEELNPGLDLPGFRRLYVAGVANADFTLDGQHRLRVSDTALALLQQFSLGHCEISAEA